MIANAVYELRNYQKLKYDFRPVRVITNMINRSLRPHYYYLEEDRTAAAKHLKGLSQQWEPSSNIASPPVSP